jgi:hypothetical protein
MEDAISKMMGWLKSRAEPGAEADEREAPLPANGAAGAPAQPPGAAGTSPLEASAASAKAAASLSKERSAAAGAAALLLQVLLLLRPHRPTAAGPAVEKQLPVTNECCAVPSFVVSRRGGSAAGAAAGAP